MHWEVYASRLCGFLFLQLAACISLWLISLSDKISILFFSPPFFSPQLKLSFLRKKNAFLVLNLKLVVIHVLIIN